jgi:hypothetical protein
MDLPLQRFATLPQVSIELALAIAATAGIATAQPAERVASGRVVGTVFLDANGNSIRDANERGIGGIAVSDQVTVVMTDSSGRFEIDAAGYGIVYVSQPDGYAVRGPFWRKPTAGDTIAFRLVRLPRVDDFIFVHASDTHISEQNVARMRRFRALVDSIKPAFVIISGDLVRDALRVPEAEARGYYERFMRELAEFDVPVFTVPGNHEIFGIERHRSLVSPDNPLYGKRLYRSLLGPNYYSFTYGGIHFLALDTVDYDDLWYFGNVDSVQLAWIERDLARLPAAARVVTFNHIPFVSGAQMIDGFDEVSPAPTVIRVDGQASFRHNVRNVNEIVALIGDRLEIALGGHMHRREFLRYATPRGTVRFAQTAAVTGPPRSDGPLGIRSGITVYRVSRGKVDDGTFVPLDP